MAVEWEWNLFMHFIISVGNKNCHFSQFNWHFFFHPLLDKNFPFFFFSHENGHGIFFSRHVILFLLNKREGILFPMPFQTIFFFIFFCLLGEKWNSDKKSIVFNIFPRASFRWSQLSEKIKFLWMKFTHDIEKYEK